MLDEIVPVILIVYYSLCYAKRSHVRSRSITTNDQRIPTPAVQWNPCRKVSVSHHTVAANICKTHTFLLIILNIYFQH
jgi:hypothetical protein